MSGPVPVIPSPVEHQRIRTAEERDLDALTAFEVEIASVTFGDEAVTDLETHRKKLAKAMERDRASMLVAEHGDRVVGWLWLAINTNFLTQQRYANFRSLAVAPDCPPGVAEALLERAIAYAGELGVVEIVGRTHVDNLPMRTLYRRYGFEPTILTMRWKPGSVTKPGPDQTT